MDHAHTERFFSRGFLITGAIVVIAAVLVASMVCYVASLGSPRTDAVASPAQTAPATVASEPPDLIATTSIQGKSPSPVDFEAIEKQDEEYLALRLARSPPLSKSERELIECLEFSPDGVGLSRMEGGRHGRTASITKPVLARTDRVFVVTNIPDTWYDFQPVSLLRDVPLQRHLTKRLRAGGIPVEEFPDADNKEAWKSDRTGMFLRLVIKPGLNKTFLLRLAADGERGTWARTTAGPCENNSLRVVYTMIDLMVDDFVAAWKKAPAPTPVPAGARVRPSSSSSRPPCDPPDSRARPVSETARRRGEPTLAPARARVAAYDGNWELKE